MPGRLEIVEFSALSNKQRKELAALRVSEQQEIFGGSFSDSINACEAEGAALRGWVFAFQDALVGMVVFKRPPLSPDWVAPTDMSIHGLKIDLRWQGNALGKEAFVLAVDAAAQTWPDVKNLVLTVDADNAAALSIYEDSEWPTADQSLTGGLAKSTECESGSRASARWNSAEPDCLG